MEGALLVGSTDRSRELLKALLPPGKMENCLTAQSGAEARRLINQIPFALVVINAPLGDESGLELSMEAAGNTTAAVLLMVKADMAENVSARVEESGVMVVSKPVSRMLFDQALRLGMTARNRMLALEVQNVKLQQKIQDIRLIDRAKCVLIQTLRMTEQQAHRHIEKQAMDTRQTKVQVAKNILSTYQM